MTRTALQLVPGRIDGPVGRPVRFRWGAGLAMAALTLAGAFFTRAPNLTDWDSWEYAAQAINKSCSGLCLGRWWFDFLMHQAYVAGSFLGLDQPHGYQAMRATVALMTAAAMVGLMYWTFLLTRKMSVAVVAGVVALVSAQLMESASAVMTEGPTLLMLMLAYLWWEKSLGRPSGGGPACSAWALAAGLAFGVAMDMREPALVLCAWPVVSCFVDRPQGRWRLLGLAAMGAVVTLGLGVWMAREIWVSQWHEDIGQRLREYGQYVDGERAHYGWPVGMNVLYLLLHILRAAPLMTLGAGAFAIWLIWGGRRSSRPWAMPGRRMAALGFSTLPYCLASWYNPDLSFNGRLILPLGWTLIPIGAAMIHTVAADVFGNPKGGGLRDPRPGRKAFFAGASSLVILLILGFLAVEMYFHQKFCRYQEELFRNVLALPQGTVDRPVAVVDGPNSPMVMYLQQTGRRPNLERVPTGFDATPDNMKRRMREQLDLGRRVFVNLSESFQKRLDGTCFEWTATYEAATAREFRQGPGSGVFVEILPPAAASMPATAAAYAPTTAP